MNRSKAPYEPICHWCKEPIISGVKHSLTHPVYSDWPNLPTGVGVAVCGKNCPERPKDAPVGRYRE